MTLTYDVTTNRGKVRLLIPDNRGTDYLFEDEEIDAFLAMETTVYAAAALALETVASDEVKTLKVVRLLDLQVDAAKAAEQLYRRADRLRELALGAEAAEEGGAVDVIEMVPNQFAYRNRVWNERLRSL